MSYSAASIANAFLLRGFRSKLPISPMMIQKLLYLAQGYHLYATDQPLIDEAFQAWRFGPVIPSIYEACKHCSSKGITQLITEMDDDLGASVPAVPPADDDRHAMQVIEFVWNEYGDYDPFEISKWTHEKGGPWDRIARGGRSRRRRDIPNGYIQGYFQDALGPRTLDNQR